MGEHEVRQAVIDAAWRAGETIVQRIESGEKLEVWEKEDHTLVLSLDLASEKVLLESLEPLLPCVSEEKPESHSLISKAKDFFLIDPLDGTTSCKRFRHARDGQIGFGPLVGLVRGGALVLSAFYHVPRRALFVATQGEGVQVFKTADEVKRGVSTLLPKPKFPSLSGTAVLFYPGIGGELLLMDYLRRHHKVENAYRFGGFANDCVRLAGGEEQIQIQFAVKAWDYSALLFPHEQGLAIKFDPLGVQRDFTSWKVQPDNPVLVSPPGCMDELLQYAKLAVTAK